MFNGFIQNLSKKTRLLFLSVIVLIFCSFGALIVYLINNPAITLQKTYFTGVKSGSVQLVGDSYYIYNGAAFYSVKSDNFKSVRVLANSQKLPRPTSINWVGNKGVLVSFGGSFINTPISEQQVGYYDRTNSTWFFDFSTKKLSFITKGSLLNQQGYFNGDSSYFLVIDNTTSIMRLVRYLPEKKQVSTILELDSSVKTAWVTGCYQNSGDVCLGTTEGDVSRKSKVKKIDNNGTVSDIFTVDGRIIQTNKPNSYGVLQNNDLISTEVEDLTPGVFKKIQAYSTQSNTYISVHLPFDSNSQSVGFLDNNLILLNLSDFSYKRVTNGVFGKKISDGRVDIGRDTLVLSPYQGNESAFQFIDTNDSLVILSNTFHSNAPVDEAGFRSYIQTCGQSVTVDGRWVDFKYKDDPSFTKEIQKSVVCIAARPELSVYYRFTFSGVSETNGRITTD